MVVRGSMPTSVPGPTTSGFTLIELLVVVSIISIGIGLLVPKFTAGTTADIRSSARTIVATIRYLSDQPIKSESQFILVIQPALNAITVMERNASGIRRPVSDPLLQKRLVLPGVYIQNVYFERQGKYTDGEQVVVIGGHASAEGWSITLRNKQDTRRMSIEVPAGFGTAMIQEHSGVTKP